MRYNLKEGQLIVVYKDTMTPVVPEDYNRDDLEGYIVKNNKLIKNGESS